MNPPESVPTPTADAPPALQLWHPSIDEIVAQESPESRGVSIHDFRAYMPNHKYIFMPTGVMCPKESIDGMLPSVKIGKDKFQKPSKWLDLHRRCETMTWQPGKPQLIEGEMMAEGGWAPRPETTCFNLYRSPLPTMGDPAQAQPWLDHWFRVYPDDAAHLIAWLAHRRQRPGDKVNHALVIGGGPGIGKDTLLEPIKHAIGPWNFADISPGQLVGRFNGYAKSTILRISEGHDLGDVDRFGFYEHSKTMIAAPPDVIRVDEKNVKEYYVPNVCGVIITTNHKTGGLYLPSDDRRHYVAWSDVTKEDFDDAYWQTLWGWYKQGGMGHVAAYLDAYDLTRFNPKAPPPKTAAFYAIVDSNRSPEDAELEDILEDLGRPRVVTLARIIEKATGTFEAWLKDRRMARQVPHRLETAGYLPIRNPYADSGLWRIGGKRQMIYGLREMTVAEGLQAAQQIARE